MLSHFICEYIIAPMMSMNAKYMQSDARIEYKKGYETILNHIKEGKALQARDIRKIQK